MPNTYDTGDRITVSTSTVFQNAAGAAFDPDVVRFKVRNPVTAVTTTYTYGVDSAVTKTGTGNYTLTIDVDSAGSWYYRIEGETSAGENRGADEGVFVVTPTTV